MEGPSDDFRATVWERAVGIDAEDAVAELLDDIAHAMARDLETGLGDPLQDLAAAESWASVASHPMARMSAPAGPWPRNVAGWGARAVGRLPTIANSPGAALAPVVAALGAASSIAVSFPWGISISLSW